MLIAVRANAGVVYACGCAAGNWWWLCNDDDDDRWECNVCECLKGFCNGLLPSPHTSTLQNDVHILVKLSPVTCSLQLTAKLIEGTRTYLPYDCVARQSCYQVPVSLCFTYTSPWSLHQRSPSISCFYFSFPHFHNSFLCFFCCLKKWELHSKWMNWDALRMHLKWMLVPVCANEWLTG